jgi:hypothetical protein
MDIALTPVATLLIPALPGFAVAEFVRPGVRNIKGVGPKLMEEIAGLSTDLTPTSMAAFYRSEVPEPADIPPTLRNRGSALSWGQLLWCLEHPDEDLFNAFQPTPECPNLGCLVSFPERERGIRVQVDWVNGHNIGGRPSKPDWTWNKGTIFGVLVPGPSS